MSTGHKYTRREWKHGHWFYYYDDDSATLDYQKGENYKSKESVNKITSRSAPKANKAKRNFTSPEQSPTSFAERGKRAVSSLSETMNTKISDLTSTAKRSYLEWLRK